MAKLITNPTECGLRIVDDRPQHICLNKRIYCPDDKVFPTKCPLQDGYTLEQVKESPTDVVDRFLNHKFKTPKSKKRE